MSDDAESARQEIVIVRRRGGDDAAAVKGGAWKIAYADFVTAMMAFFLVMWLINASNEETRAQVASYFNPIKLTDSSTGPRGLKDKQDKNTQAGEANNTAGGTPPAKSDVQHEAELMANPDKALEKIETKLKAAAEDAARISENGMDEVSSASGDSSAGAGDPFDPRAWEKIPEATAPAPLASDAPEVLQPAVTESKDDHSDSLVAEASKKTVADVAPQKSFSAELSSPSKNIAAAERESPHSGSAPDTEAAARQQASDPALANRQIAEAAAISAAIAAKLGTGLEDLPASVEIRVTEDGLLISLTDKQSFGMFKTGSAEPQPELVRLVEAIAGALAGRPGYIVIRGHTDSRPYRNKKYDNWQLSTARAHLAQYMLVRGGLDGQRIQRVEGVADREPRNTKDPQAPENRRIEILLGRE